MSLTQHDLAAKFRKLERDTRLLKLILVLAIGGVCLMGAMNARGQEVEFDTVTVENLWIKKPDKQGGATIHMGVTGDVPVFTMSEKFPKPSFSISAPSGGTSFQMFAHTPNNTHILGAGISKEGFSASYFRPEAGASVTPFKIECKGTDVSIPYVDERVASVRSDLETGVNGAGNAMKNLEKEAETLRKTLKAEILQAIKTDEAYRSELLKLLQGDDPTSNSTNN